MNYRLRVKIIERFHTQADFALELGENESLISRVIRGRRDIPDEKKRIWAKALKTEVQDVFS